MSLSPINTHAKPIYEDQQHLIHEYECDEFIPYALHFDKQLAPELMQRLSYLIDVSSSEFES